jgi:hypothetical protein
METVKEILVDALILVCTWFIVTAGSIAEHSKGVTCGSASSEKVAKVEQ